MGSAGASSVILLILNVFHVLLSLGLAACSIWFFIEVQGITSLRNANHYLLDYNVYWPQAIPWVFFIASILALTVSCCGFIGAKKKSRGLVVMYIIFEVVVILALIAAAILALVFADATNTDKFVKDTIWDDYIHMKSDVEVEKAFGLIERRFQCCGADGPRDYINWKNGFPPSCCDTYYHGWIGGYAIDCDFTNKLANERHGCSQVVANYARIAIKVFSAVAIFTAFIGLMSLIVAATLSRGLKKKPRILVAQHESESKKVLL